MILRRVGSSRPPIRSFDHVGGRGEVRWVRPEPSTCWMSEPRLLGEFLDHLRPGGGRPGATEARPEELLQHLGEEVVGVAVGGVDDLGRSAGSGPRRAIWRRAGVFAERDRRADRIPEWRMLLSSVCGRRFAGSAEKSARAGVAGEAGVEVEAGERADVGSRSRSWSRGRRVCGRRSCRRRRGGRSPLDPGSLQLRRRGRRRWSRGPPGSCRRRPGVPRVGSPPPCR